MCYYISNNLTKKEIKDSFGVEYNGPEFKASGFVNGFSYPKTPIIMDEHPEEAILGDWGLIPFWAKNRDVQKMTLNARIETLTEKPSFKNSVSNRCLVLVNGFYEWKWLDSKGKNKEKYFITLDNGNKPFALGGIYNIWTDKNTNETLTSFSIVTSNANELMAEIHNSKDRMPLVLSKEAEKNWLSDRPIDDFAFPHYDPALIALNLDSSSSPKTLF
ncbi:SOS response-associated peptidase [Kaistella flava (ex Peng et al. 2021)]|uniref:Abasic site processing protein n=1 Tax=Kaistella flava (ex Peng et al. 2021) TaxID=2038776 RepID=A0A7M2Y854_9FLAO|nr:SOS response-associated peptidase [Kaistella flava (ex Peng et al. 2021)]QOW10286.1 SOS response-associated peptidase [Kaistella flava (ex Peng et al. 2021)]